MNFQSLIARQRAHKILPLVLAVLFFLGTAALAAGTPVFACGFGTGCLHCNHSGRAVLDGPACCSAPGGFSAAACGMTCCGDGAGMSARFQFVAPDSGVDGIDFSNLIAGTSPDRAGISLIPADSSQGPWLPAAAATVVYLQNLSLRL